MRDIIGIIRGFVKCVKLQFIWTTTPLILVIRFLSANFRSTIKILEISKKSIQRSYSTFIS